MTIATMMMMMIKCVSRSRWWSSRSTRNVAKWTTFSREVTAQSDTLIITSAHNTSCAAVDKNRWGFVITRSLSIQYLDRFISIRWLASSQRNSAPASASPGDRERDMDVDGGRDKG